MCLQAAELAISTNSKVAVIVEGEHGGRYVFGSTPEWDEAARQFQAAEPSSSSQPQVPAASVGRATSYRS